MELEMVVVLLVLLVLVLLVVPVVLVVVLVLLVVMLSYVKFVFHCIQVEASREQCDFCRAANFTVRGDTFWFSTSLPLSNTHCLPLPYTRPP